ncbi:hypothetical protein B0H67DRAFT_342659 [Lasiosphaeris hirsuta]|uniref:Uncharacterized protein n=1 Tax=Lasiosphaeris hirsuta TaxID=260670 RepID=A0AA40DLW4_9PEZI|nr:hypothetical protein B0H67DRAFT_342659 [Lasiosphaeris hirsuta]
MWASRGRRASSGFLPSPCADPPPRLRRCRPDGMAMAMPAVERRSTAIHCSRHDGTAPSFIRARSLSVCLSVCLPASCVYVCGCVCCYVSRCVCCCSLPAASQMPDLQNAPGQGAGALCRLYADMHRYPDAVSFGPTWRCPCFDRGALEICCPIGRESGQRLARSQDVPALRGLPFGPVDNLAAVIRPLSANHGSAEGLEKPEQAARPL